MSDFLRQAQDKLLSVNNQKGAVHLLLPVIILLTISLVALGKVQTTIKFNDSNVQGVIAKNDDNKAGESSNRGGPSEEVRLKQEVRTSDEKIKTDVKEDKTKIDVSRAGTKNKIQQQGDEITTKTEIKDKKNEVEDEATESAEQVDEAVRELRATSKFPLRIDLSTNQLIMTKDGVERVLTTLPAQAVQNMLRAHLKKGLGPKFFQATPSATPVGTPSATISPSATPSASPEEPIASDSANITVLENQISLEEVNGQIVYKIPAKKKVRLFGFIPITTDLTGFVSSQTGVLIEEKQSLLSRILDLLSP